MDNYFFWESFVSYFPLKELDYYPWMVFGVVEWITKKIFSPYSIPTILTSNSDEDFVKTTVKVWSSVSFLFFPFSDDGEGPTSLRP